MYIYGDNHINWVVVMMKVVMIKMTTMMLMIIMKIIRTIIMIMMAVSIQGNGKTAVTCSQEELKPSSAAF